MIVSRIFRNKEIIILTGCACIGGYVAYRYWKKRLLRTIDEGFEEVTKIDDSNEKRVLLLGLEGAGKTSLINQAAAANDKNCTYTFPPQPTHGFVVHKLEKGYYNFHIWEIGGSEDTRQYWSSFLRDIDLLIFVIDAADTKKLPSAVFSLKELLGDSRMDLLPILVIGNKQDLPNALKPEEVKEALDLRSFPHHKHKLQVVGCQTQPFPDTVSTMYECNWYHSSVLNALDKICTMAVSF